MNRMYRLISSVNVRDDRSQLQTLYGAIKNGKKFMFEAFFTLRILLPLQTETLSDKMARNEFRCCNT